MSVKRKHGVRYPWAKWFKSGKTTLLKGVDFDGQPHGMAQTARQAASRHGVALHISVQEDRIVMEVVR